MRGERYQNAIVLILIVLVFASVPLILNFAGIWFLWAPLLVVLGVLPSVFLREGDLAAGLRGPPQVRDTLAADLRMAGIAVTSKPDSVEARIDALSAIQFRTRITDHGTVLSGQLRTTRAGLILLVALVVSVVGSGPAAFVSLVLFLRATRFGRSHAPAAFRGPLESAPVAERDDVRGMLVGSLSTALKISRDALDAQGKAYTDAKAYLVMNVLTVWFVVLIGLFVAFNGFNSETGVWALPVAGAFAAAFVVGVGLFVVLRRRFAPRLAPYRTWIARLGSALEDEMSPAGREPPATSTFELLAEASTHVPDWLDAQRVAGLSRDPVTSFGILVLTGFCATLLIEAIFAGIGGAIGPFVVFSILAALPAALAAWVYLRWKRKEDARLRQSRAAWDAHMKDLLTRMGRFLQEM
jgi:hypothetical protein